jgi:von Willebrand factor type A domain
MNRITKLATGSAIAALVAMVGVVPTAGASTIPNCTKATNIESITDDSSSMLGTDPGRLRAALLEIIAGSPLEAGNQMGGVEFGDTAGPVFPVQPIGTSGAATIIGSQLSAVQGNGYAGQGSSTNYNAGFTAGNAQNGSANARIFLSDGQPNTGDYDPNIPKNPPTKTFVVGFDAAATSAAATLQEIAANTGGQVFIPANGTSAALQQTAGDVLAALSCKTPPLTSTINFTKPNQVKPLVFKATGNTADIILSWASTSTIINPPTTKAAGLVATDAKKKGKVKIGNVNKGTTFNSVRVKGIKKGQKVKLKVKAKSAFGATPVTAQIIQ